MTSFNLAEQYATDENLRIRIETHRLYTVGQQLEPAIDKTLSLTGGESLLDIGAGPGDFLIRLRSSGHRGRLVAVDNSPGMLDKGKSAGADIEFVLADAQSLPLADHSFDVVTARHMLYHVPNISRAIGEAHRVLRPGGKFLAVTNVSGNFAEFREALGEAADTLKGKIANVLRMTVPVSEVFNERNGSELIRSAFGNFSVSFVESALRFDAVRQPLRYFDSCRTMKGFSQEEWKIARGAFEEIVNKRMAAGPWTISKTVVLFLAVK